MPSPYDAAYGRVETAGGGGGPFEAAAAAVVGPVGGYEQAAQLGNALLLEGNKFLQQANIIGEGPKPLRAFCFLGGVALTCVGFLSTVNVMAFLSGPPTYIIETYLTFFGCVCMVIEAKEMPYLCRFKPFIQEWLKFLTVPGGKGAFYVFLGSTAISIWSSNIPLVIIGAYVGAMGIICILVHFGLSRQLRRSGIEVDDGTPSNFVASPDVQHS